MLLRLTFFFALASEIVSALYSTPLAAPAGSVVISEPLATAHTVPHYEPINDYERAEIKKRQFRVPPGQAGMAQYIIGPCPELFSENHVAVQHCSSCGGENLANLGNCLERNEGNRICKCTNDGRGANGVTTSLITVTQNGEIATGTFELETFTQYAGLRQSITATTTVSTTTEGGTGLETAAVVVLAGGVAWFLADIGGSAAAAAALPGPETPSDHQDDKTCPDPKGQCKDCGGHEQMCTTGPNTGCACEEHICPADESDEQPGCEEDTCVGQDGKCTTGEHNGCNCAPLDCPETEHFWCRDCGGPDDAGKCKGDPQYENEYRGCECKAEPDWSQALKPLRRSNTAAHQAKLVSLPDIIYEKPTPEPTPDSKYPKCNMDQISGVRSAAFKQGTFNAFCDAIKNGDKSKPSSQTVDIRGAVIPASKRSLSIFRRSPPVNLDLYNDYKFGLSWTGGDNTCSSDCAETFNSMATSPCGYTSGDQNIMTTEASLDTGCGTYSWKVIKPGEGGPEIPTKPEMSPSCADPSVYTRFTLQEAEDAVKDFCAVDISLPSAAQPVQKTYNLREVTLQLSTQWSQSGQDGCRKEISGEAAFNTPLSAAECSQYFLSAVNECNKDTRTAKFGSKPLIWNSPRGCIDFNIYGNGPEYSAAPFS